MLWMTRLGEQVHVRVGVAKVEVHQGDERDAHEDAADTLADLGEVVVAVRGGHEFAGLLRLRERRYIPWGSSR